MRSTIAPNNYGADKYCVEQDSQKNSTLGRQDFNRVECIAGSGAMVERIAPYGF
jgi:hypothetical protein